LNTFLPYPDFVKSAQCLDYRRLGKQRVEAWQIYLALTKENYGWKNHPIVKMWNGYAYWLLYYGVCICLEWRNRGYKDTMLDKFVKEWRTYTSCYYKPKWLGNKNFHSAMRSNLLRKDKKYYSKFGWKEKDNLLYYWIIK
jgi:hypothetical protein